MLPDGIDPLTMPSSSYLTQNWLTWTTGQRMMWGCFSQITVPQSTPWTSPVSLVWTFPCVIGYTNVSQTDPRKYEWAVTPRQAFPSVWWPTGLCAEPLLYSLYTYDCRAMYRSKIDQVDQIRNAKKKAALQEVKKLSLWWQDIRLHLSVSKTKEMLVASGGNRNYGGRVNRRRSGVAGSASITTRSVWLREQRQHYLSTKRCCSAGRKCVVLWRVSWPRSAVSWHGVSYNAGLQGCMRPSDLVSRNDCVGPPKAVSRRPCGRTRAPPSGGYRVAAKRKMHSQQSPAALCAGCPGERGLTVGHPGCRVPQPGGTSGMVSISLRQARGRCPVGHAVPAPDSQRSWAHCSLPLHWKCTGSCHQTLGLALELRTEGGGRQDRQWLGRRQCNATSLLFPGYAWFSACWVLVLALSRAQIKERVLPVKLVFSSIAALAMPQSTQRYNTSLIPQSPVRLLIWFNPSLSGLVVFGLIACKLAVFKLSMNLY